MNSKAIKNNICISFFPYVDPELIKNNDKNESVVHRVISEFQNDPLTSSDRKILFYFGMHNNKLGFYISKDLNAEYNGFKDKYNFEIPLMPSFDSYQGIIYIWFFRVFHG